MQNKKIIEKPMKIELEGYDVQEKIVKSGGNSGRVYVPVDWLNCRVKVIRLDELNRNKEEK